MAEAGRGRMIRRVAAAGWLAVFVAVLPQPAAGPASASVPIAGWPGLVPTPIGAGAAYHPRPGPARPAVVDGLRCGSRSPVVRRVHVELFAHRRVVLVPAGVGIGPPRRGRAAVVTGGGCWYPVRTVAPTGVVQVATSRPVVMGDLFDVWGEPLSGRRMLGFRGRVAAFVNGRRWAGGVAAIPLTAGAEIVVEVAGYVPPHARYRFSRAT
jgi:hypothetical protein